MISRSRSRKIVSALAAVLVFVVANWFVRRDSARQDGMPSILVPPFRILNVADRTSLGSGLVRGVEGALTATEGLAVRPWTVAVPEAPTDDAAAVRAGRRLHTTYVLVGEVEGQADRTEIAIRLLRVRDGTPVWSGTYWRDLVALPAFPSELALDIADALRLPTCLGRCGASLRPHIPSEPDLPQ